MSQNHTFKQFAKYAFLNVLGMLGLSCYILADTFFIANRLGANGLTALNLALPVYSFVHGSGLMLGMGGATKFSICQAGAKQKDANSYFTNTLYIAVLLSLIYVLSGILLSDFITTILGANDTVFSMTKTYLRMILLFSPAFILNDIFICYVRNDKSPRLAMLAMVSGSLSNIVLDYVFLFPLNMGILGAVFATGLAPIISMGVLSTHLIKRNNTFSLQRIQPKFHKIITLILLGIPSLITELSSGIVMIIFNLLLLKTAGNIGVAAYGIIANLALVLVSIFTGIAQGMQPLLSRAYGSRNTKEISKLLRYGIVTSVALSVFIYTLLFVGAETVTGLFNSEKNTTLQELAIRGMKLYFTSAIFTSINIILTTYYSALEKAVPAQIVSLLRGLLLMIPIAFGMAHWFGLTGIWITLPATEAITTLIATMLYKYYKTKNPILSHDLQRIHRHFTHQTQNFHSRLLRRL